MRLVMLANGPFALPTLEAIARSRHRLLALVTRPVADRHGGNEVHSTAGPVGPAIQSSAKRRRAFGETNPVAAAARALGVDVLTPPTVNDQQARNELHHLGPEILVVCDYGEILASETLEVAPRGAINLHGSLLPKYRGAAPVAWAIYHGETETGVTVFQISTGVDDGPCLAQESMAIAPDETAGELENRLAELGGRLVCRTLDQLEQAEVQPVAQDSGSASRARKLRKSDGLIDWSRSAGQIRNQVRAMQPWPTAYTFCATGRGSRLRLIVVEAVPFEPNEPAVPGTVVGVREGLRIAAGQGSVELRRVQPAGGRVMTRVSSLSAVTGWFWAIGWGAKPDDETGGRWAIPLAVAKPHRLSCEAGRGTGRRPVEHGRWIDSTGFCLQRLPTWLSWR
jgi:methionyl-tRNA formyltransferase